MSTENYQNMLKEISNKILNNKLKYKNTIIIGDNSSGKSEVLKSLFEYKKEGYYFIDSVNRSFDFTKVSSLKGLELGSYKKVVERRVDDVKNFNLEDSFDVFGDGNGSIEQVYFNYDKRVKSLFKELLNIDFNIEIKDNLIIGKKPLLKIGNEFEKLSSGFQAIIRILLEICYFEDSLEKDIKNPFVVIDEVNEFLSSKNEEKMLPFLKKNFKQMNFIVTTHSPDIIASSEEFNIIALKSNNYQCLDGNDYRSVTDVREIFAEIYDIKDDDKADHIEFTLRNLLNLKISNAWTDIEEHKLKLINENRLSNAQKLLLTQIKSW
ncbi:MAG: hypothetical protein LLF98_10320 [Clostridium sp.]|uniref:hypothetical protein n=1 Tax=Clostridium sp. TaxID=1506 RepID=UPI0025BD9F73|nr:hypothetical protein [Clostridium sp.]MCE5221632.1 hypothetical protein [Clostridium sp.]